MNRLLLILSLVFAAVLIGTATAAPPPDPQITQLKKQLRDARSDKADLQDTVRAMRNDKADLRVHIEAQDRLIEDQADTNQRLRTRIANQPDPMDVILNRDPDGLWSAAQAIWRAFPNLDEGTLCGYDKSSTQSDDLTPATYAFYRYSTC